MVAILCSATYLANTFGVAIFLNGSNPPAVALGCASERLRR
jgi:hypothetical protein